MTIVETTITNEIQKLDENLIFLKDNFNIEIKNIKYQNTTTNDIKSAILNNEPIDDILHIIIVISNPCQYQSRYNLANNFINRMKNEKNTKLYIVELTYNEQKFVLTEKNNPCHLQLNCTHPLWHKENMINLGVQKLLPNNWKAFAWIDADIEFENPHWALETLKILNGTCDFIQLFSHAVDMNKNGDAMSIFSSFGFQYIKKRIYTKSHVNKMWHPGYAWACTKDAYNKMNGLYEHSIVGSGDNNMATSLIGLYNLSIHEYAHDDYKNDLFKYQSNILNLRLGYTPGVIRHYFHGFKKNRLYKERWEILISNQYSPKLHITKNKDGLLVPSPQCPSKLVNDIREYFFQRLEDD